MPADRYYCPETLIPGALVTLPGAENIHLRRVMRKKVGDKVELFDGRGHLVSATLMSDKELTVDTLLEEAAPSQKITIAQAILPPGKLDWVTEKCAELGASSLWLYPAEQSEKTHVSDSLLARLQTIAISAAKQSGRLFLMDIEVKPPLKQWPAYDNLYFGDQASPSNRPSHDDFIFVIGPEKGFSSSERKLLQKGQALSLSPYTLRTETAALVLLSLLQ
jgi:16S rRNA (uracil1498-N3)-methyltransferase